MDPFDKPAQYETDQKFLLRKNALAKFITFLFSKSLDIESVEQSISDSKETFFVVRTVEKLEAEEAEKLVAEFNQ